MGNWRIDGVFHLRSPLSHISSVDSTSAWLAQEPVLQPDGTVAEVFALSGNSWRGQLRDAAALYMFDRLGNPRMTLDAFHLFMSGGAIGGATQVDLGRARAYRQAVPLVSLFGGGVGNQILPGKLRVQNCYPWCREAPAPDWTPAGLPPRESVRYSRLTTEKSFSRMDDSKDERVNAPLRALPSGEQMTLLGAAPAKEAKKAGPPTQMRYTVELVIAGAALLMRTDVLDATDAELGCLVSALHWWSRSPHLGGQANKGHGLVALDSFLTDTDTGAREPFVRVTDRCLMAPPAEAAKAAYDQVLREAYERMLDANGAEIRQLIGVA